MIYINHSKKAIYIHIPKTGGTYIGDILVKYYGFINYLHVLHQRRPDHDVCCKIGSYPKVLTKNSLYNHSFFNKKMGILAYCQTSEYLNQQMDMDAEKWNTYTKFCFVRNPYVRAISGWVHFKQELNLPYDFLHYIRQHPYHVSDIEFGHIFMNQTTQIENALGECGVDYIGKFETLETDFKYILRALGFSIVHPENMRKKNVSNINNSDVYTFDKVAIMHMNKLFKRDFDMLHYVAIK